MVKLKSLNEANLFDMLLSLTLQADTAMEVMHLPPILYICFVPQILMELTNHTLYIDNIVFAGVCITTERFGLRCDISSSKKDLWSSGYIFYTRYFCFFINIKFTFNII